MYNKKFRGRQSKAGLEAPGCHPGTEFFSSSHYNFFSDTAVALGILEVPGGKEEVEVVEAALEETYKCLIGQNRVALPPQLQGSLGRF